MDKYLDELSDFLSIPSISAQSIHDKDNNRACNWLEKRISKLGFKTRIFDTLGHPVLYAQNLDAGIGKPTILIYGHYDVQSPDPIAEWNTDPFKPVIKNGNIYARGASDDKGQLYTWIAAVDTLLNQEKQLPVNIKFLIEGEEEVGSANLDHFIEKNKGLLKADVCTISDTHALSESQPMIDYGLRGLLYLELTVSSLKTDVHSGTYGGNVANPANVLAFIIASLKDKYHKIKIPGFYDNVRRLSPKERKSLSSLDFSEQQIMFETGAKALAGEKDYSIHERAGARPTLDVNGMWSGYTGEGPKTIIPKAATAKISMRLVPNQTSNEITAKFENYVRLLSPSEVDIKIEQISKGEPILMNIDSKYFKAAEKAYELVFGKKPVYELSGGSIPVTATLKNLLGIDSVLMGYGLPDDNLHAPNEKLSLRMFEKGILTNIEFLKNIS